MTPQPQVPEWMEQAMHVDNFFVYIFFDLCFFFAQTLASKPRRHSISLPVIYFSSYVYFASTTPSFLEWKEGFEESGRLFSRKRMGTQRLLTYPTYLFYWYQRLRSMMCWIEMSLILTVNLKLICAMIASRFFCVDMLGFGEHERCGGQVCVCWTFERSELVLH